MMNLIKKFFGKSDNQADNSSKEFSNEEYERDDELKSIGLEEVLGKMSNMVGHSIIPFSLGGAVDLYYFPNHIEGTGFATMELLDPAGKGPLPNRLGTYELVAFTKQQYNSNNEQFNIMEYQIRGFLTAVGSFSRQAVLNPNETCEVPNEDGGDNTCLVFDLYEPNNKVFRIGKRTHHLLLCLEIYRSEMDFAMENGSQELFNKLKEKGYYPYSDLDRNPVV